ncbi:metalloregulator ArsR/SmtB family transcription factor [Peribacillus kribbensis]|uniref:DUF2087 domain-containing protein n=1 Tax=Peribacillus kribbensis TaxID=356658 RepID=UPI00047C765A|nr:metalloregulator ArsR/SmtB family transcription factor [Peribacillus kribbensis]
MQLNKLVQFNRALSDPNRVRILAMLSSGPKNGLEIADALGLTPPTVTHHIKKLRDINLLTEKKEKNCIYFYIKESVLMHYANSITSTILKGGINTMEEEKNSLEARIKHFFTADGRLKNLPSQRKKKLWVLYFLAGKFVLGVKYSEKEVNESIKTFHEDYATIRREFIITGIMHRENGIYELNPKEIWEVIQ